MRTPDGPHFSPLLSVSRDEDIPLHRQVYDAIRRAILDGMLQAGQRVPATRALAAELGVSRFTVSTAYDQLLHEGYVEARVGSGTYVRAAIPDDAFRSAHGPTRGSPASGPTSVAECAAPMVPVHSPAGVRDEGELWPFRVSLPALDAFPRTGWARLVARHARSLGPSDMAYGDPAGLPELRAAVAAHLRTARAVRCDAEQVLIVSGSQVALRLCAAVLLDPGDRVALEEPGYAGARAAFVAARATLVPVPVDGDGLDVAALAAAGGSAGDIRAAYVTPSHQYPLGASMSAGRRLALVEWARRHDAWVVEDDYDSEYRYVSRPLGALQGLQHYASPGPGGRRDGQRGPRTSNTDDRVIYIGTFSKVLFPALRIGYVVVPGVLWDAFLAVREALDLFPPTLYQRVLADFLEQGLFARHLRRMRAIYTGRRDALLDGLARHTAGLLTVLNADAGLHIATLLPDDMDDATLVRQLRARRLAPAPLSTCYLGTPKHGLLLGFGGSHESALGRATEVLGETLRAQS